MLLKPYSPLILKTINLTALTFLLFTFNLSFSQTTTESFSCGFDVLHQLNMQNDIDYRNNYLETEEYIYKYITENRIDARENNVITIPIVFHIIHVGEPLGTGLNIPDESIFETIRGLNDKYRGVVLEGVDMEVDFCLAKQTPDGLPSTGIIRIDASDVPEYEEFGVAYYGGDNGASISEIRNLSSWPTDHAFNVWVVNDVVGVVAIGSSLGVIMQVAQMTYGEVTLTHELGHTLSLLHPFQGSVGNNCPPNNDCLLDNDKVCDTPPQVYLVCGVGPNPCTDEGIYNNSSRNYMSYCPNKKLFTLGQKERVHAYLSTHSIVNSIACQDADYDAQIVSIDVDCENDIAINLKNATIDTLQNLSIYWSIDDVLQDSINWMGSLLEGESIDITIGNLANNDFPLNIKAWIAMPNGFNDSNTGNDTVTILNFEDITIVADFSFETDNEVATFMNTSTNYTEVNWDFDDGFSSSEVNPEHNYSSSNNYEVTLVAVNDFCSDTITKTVTISVLTSIDLNSKIESVVLYPNPNNGQFELVLKADNFQDYLDLSLWDLQGKQIDKRTVKFNNYTKEKYKFTALPSGTYILQIDSTEGTMSFKVEISN